jgi:[ribosomal protein S18]-alanine N-acetyltransferase
MTDHFSIAPLGALDLDRAAALHAESFVPLGERAWTRQDLAELVASPGVAGLLLQVDGHDAGLAVCRVAADEAELLTIAVQPAHRRKGLARRLLAAVIDHARNAGARTLFLEVGVDNPAARSLYEAQGFRVVGERRAYYQRGQGPAADGIVMRLTLI